MYYGHVFMQVSRSIFTFGHGERLQEMRTELTEGHTIVEQDH
jgi:hypothetical protein